MCANWLPVSLNTATCALTATNPPEPAKEMTSAFSFEVASTSTASPRPEPAVMLEFAAMLASARLSTFSTRIAAPMPTKPPATAPASPVTSSLSFARTRTLPPASIVPSIRATVPEGSGAVTALVAGVRGRSARAVAMEPDEDVVRDEILSLMKLSCVACLSLLAHSVVFTSGDAAVSTTSCLAWNSWPPTVTRWPILYDVPVTHAGVAAAVEPFRTFLKPGAPLLESSSPEAAASALP